MNSPPAIEPPPEQRHMHLDWSAKQSRIHTDQQNSLSYYSDSHGFPFLPEECPHFYLEQGNSHAVFRTLSSLAATPETAQVLLPIVGAWSRPLFVGKWEHSTKEDEIVYNVQTRTLFVDLRIPRTKPLFLCHSTQTSSDSNAAKQSRQILEEMTDLDLRMFARQHVFGGIAVRVSPDTNGSTTTAGKASLPVCVRYHCIDWNYIPGKPRPRPNKWFIEGRDNGDLPFQVWRECSYATDNFGQSYYWERWERLQGDEMGNGLRLALRKKDCTDQDGSHEDAILVAVGDHFNYVIGSRQTTQASVLYPNATNAVDLIDFSLQEGDRNTAITLLLLDGGHGTITSGWKIDCAIHYWRHGRRVFDCIAAGNLDLVKVNILGRESDFHTWEVILGNVAWEVYECSLKSASELESLLKNKKDNEQCPSNSRL